MAINITIDEYAKAYGGKVSRAYKKVGRPMNAVEYLERHMVGLTSGQVKYIFQKATGCTISEEELAYLSLNQILVRCSPDQLRDLARYFQNLDRAERSRIMSIGKGYVHEQDEGVCREIWDEI
jgi:hypothetical protein